MSDFTVCFYFASGTTKECTLPEVDLYSFLNALSQRFVILKTEIINTNQVESIQIFEPTGTLVNVSQLLQTKTTTKKGPKTITTLDSIDRDCRVSTITKTSK